MNYQLTSHEAWTLALLNMIATPIIANKTDRYPLMSIIQESPLNASLTSNEVKKIKMGFEALRDLGIIQIDRTDVIATELTDFIYQALHYVGTLQRDDALIEISQSPRFSALLEKINIDARLSPETYEDSSVEVHSNSYHHAEKEGTSFIAKIGYSIFVFFVLIGLLNMVLKYLL